MPLSNYPNGLSSFGIPLVGSGPILTTGKVFFVSSVVGNNENPGTDPEKPFATIDYAVGKCTANKNDYIIAMPGHVETVSAAAGLVFDVAGVTVVGLGAGSLRPTINLTTSTAADVDIDAANITIVNFQFTGNIDNLALFFDVNAAYFSLIDCEYRDVTGECATFWNGDANADFGLVQNFRYRGASGSGTSIGFRLAGLEGMVFDGLYMDGNFSTAGISCQSAACSNIEIRNVVFRTRNSADLFLVDTITGSTGIIGPNISIYLADNAANITEACTGATFVYFQPINVVNLAGESSMQTNITASTDA